MQDKVITGNKIVDAVGQMNIFGNIVPLSWHRELTMENWQA